MEVVHTKEMETDKNFISRKPDHAFLSTIVEHYFYIDIPVAALALETEFMIPFPRITFGYFFDHPFAVTNHTLNQSKILNLAIARISTQKITVAPQTERIRILGAHLKPFGLAYFTAQSIKSLPWLINTEALFGAIAENFIEKVKACTSIESMFQEVEKVFLAHLLERDLSLITQAIERIEEDGGSLEITELAALLGVSDRTLRNHFYASIGCSPKEYLRIVKMKQIAYQLKHSEGTLTDIAYDNNYFDQAHFIHEIKGITGQSPNQLRKEIPHFRFLQF